MSIANKAGRKPFLKLYKKIDSVDVKRLAPMLTRPLEEPHLFGYNKGTVTGQGEEPDVQPQDFRKNRRKFDIKPLVSTDTEKTVKPPVDLHQKTRPPMPVEEKRPENPVTEAQPRRRPRQMLPERPPAVTQNNIYITNTHIRNTTIREASIPDFTFRDSPSELGGDLLPSASNLFSQPFAALPAAAAYPHAVSQDRRLTDNAGQPYRQLMHVSESGQRPHVNDYSINGQLRSESQKEELRQLIGRGVLAEENPENDRIENILY